MKTSCAATIVWSLFTVTGICGSNGSAALTRESQFQKVCSMAASNGMGSIEMRDKLKQLINDKDGQADDVSLAAKELLIGHFQALDTKDSLEQAKQVSLDLIKEVPNTWQADLAFFHLVAIEGLLGNYDRQISYAQEALVRIDFIRLENAHASTFHAIRKAYGAKPQIFRDSLKAMLMNALCNKGRISEAKEVHGTIQDRECADIMRKRIQSAEKAERDRQSRTNGVRPKMTN